MKDFKLKTSTSNLKVLDSKFQPQNFSLNSSFKFRSQNFSFKISVSRFQSQDFSFKIPVFTASSFKKSRPQIQGLQLALQVHYSSPSVNLNMEDAEVLSWQEFGSFTQLGALSSFLPTLCTASCAHGGGQKKGECH